jgi:excisionase family DNA binding protein
VKGRDVRLTNDEVALLRLAVASVVPAGQLLTSGEAATVLNVSPAYMDRLLRDERIPWSTVPGSSHRRILLGDVMEYKRTRDRVRAEAMDRVVAIGEEAQSYEDELREVLRTRSGEEPPR